MIIYDFPIYTFHALLQIMKYLLIRTLLEGESKGRETRERSAYLIACIMLLELLVHQDPDAVQALAASFYKYSASTLRTLKKQLPQKATEKLERIIKDRNK